MSEKKIKFLVEKYPEQDELDNTTHEKIAQNLYEIINNCNESVTIGLEGEWGTGKSTIIKLLKDIISNKVDNSKTIKVFCFDAWAHNNDPLRKTFLERLLIFLKDDISSAKHKEIEKKIKTVTIQSHVKYSISRWGIAFTIAMLIFTAGLTLLGKDGFYNLEYFGWLPGNELTAVFLIAMPFLFFLIYFLFNLSKEGNSIGNVILNKEDSCTKVVLGGDKTSVEFEEFFINIVREVLCNNENRLVIVLDNLDRIDNVSEVWSTMQVFFNHDEKMKDIYKKIWFIIPFSKKMVDKICIDKDEDRQFFIEKCFQIRIDVPKITIENWESFLRKQIREISFFGKDEKERIIENFRLNKNAIEENVTPREIKNYLNQVQVLKMLADKDVETDIICCYAFQRFIRHKSIEEIKKELLDDTLRTNYPYLSKPQKHSHRAMMSALIFCENPSKSMQLLLQRQVENMLYGRDIKEFHNFYHSDKAVFRLVVDDVLNRLTLNNETIHKTTTIVLWIRILSKGVLNSYKLKLRDFWKNGGPFKFPKINDKAFFKRYLKFIKEKMEPGDKNDFMDYFLSEFRNGLNSQDISVKDLLTFWLLSYEVLEYKKDFYFDLLEGSFLERFLNALKFSSAPSLKYMKPAKRYIEDLEYDAYRYLDSSLSHGHTLLIEYMYKNDIKFSDSCLYKYLCEIMNGELLVNSDTNELIQIFYLCIIYKPERRPELNEKFLALCAHVKELLYPALLKALGFIINSSPSVAISLIRINKFLDDDSEKQIEKTYDILARDKQLFVLWRIKNPSDYALIKGLLKYIYKHQVMEFFKCSKKVYNIFEADDGKLWDEKFETVLNSQDISPEEKLVIQSMKDAVNER